MTEELQDFAVGLALLAEEDALIAEEQALRAEDQAVRAEEKARLAAELARSAREQAATRAAASLAIALRPSSVEHAPVLAVLDSPARASAELLAPTARPAFAITISPAHRIVARSFRGDLRAIRCVLHRELRGFFTEHPRVFTALVRPALFVVAFSLAGVSLLAKLLARSS